MGARRTLAEAEKRLAEYWDWRRVHDGNVDADEGISQREERWAAA